MVVGGGMLLWGQYNSAAQIYDIGVNHVQAEELLSADEEWSRPEEENRIYESVLKDGESFMAETEKRNGVYSTVTATEIFGKTVPQELPYAFYDNGSDQTVILLHAYNETTQDAAMFAPYWWSRGFNVLIPSIRGDADQKGISAFGVYEQYDLLDLIEKENLNAEGMTLVVHGKGLGSTAALLLAGNPAYSERASIDFVVADTTFANLKELELKLLKHHFSLGNFMVGMMLDAIIKSSLGFDVRGIDIATAAASLTIPAMFISGENDDYLGPDMTKEVFDACQSEKSFLLVQGAGYGMNYAVSKNADNEYEEQLDEWLARIS